MKIKAGYLACLVLLSAYVYCELKPQNVTVQINTQWLCYIFAPVAIVWFLRTYNISKQIGKSDKLLKTARLTAKTKVKVTDRLSGNGILPNIPEEAFVDENAETSELVKPQESIKLLKAS